MEEELAKYFDNHAIDYSINFRYSDTIKNKNALAYSERWQKLLEEDRKRNEESV